MTALTDEDLELYETLYIRYGNDSQCFDYEDFLKRYKSYIYAFCFLEDSNFYMDLDFLQLVVNGFEHYHDLYFGNEIINFDEITPYILNTHRELKERGKIDGNFSAFEHIFMATVICNTKLINSGLAENCPDIVQKLVDNSYQVSKVYKKEYNGS